MKHINQSCGVHQEPTITISYFLGARPYEPYTYERSELFYRKGESLLTLFYLGGTSLIVSEVHHSSSWWSSLPLNR